MRRFSLRWIYTAFVSIALMFVVTPSRAAEYETGKEFPLYTFQHFEELLKTKWSIEAVAESLPEELQTNVTIVMEPRNRLQEGPRAIRFTSDGRLIITHNDDPTKKGGLNIEIREKDENGNSIVHDIEFSADGKTPPIISKGKPFNHGPALQSCTSCHGESGRLIYRSYPKWNGACGEDDDLVTERIDQKCFEFLQKAKTHPRFKDMKWDPDNLSWPYHNGAVAQQPHKFRNLSTMPNTRFTLLVQIDNAIQMANVVEASPLYEKLKYSLLEQYACRPGASSEKREKLNTLLARSEAVSVPSDWKGTKLEYVTEISTEQTQHSPEERGDQLLTFSKQRYNYLEFFGIPMGNTGANEKIVRNGITEIGYDGDSKITTSADYLTVRLLGRIGKLDPVIGKMTGDPKSYVKKTKDAAFIYKVDAKFKRLIEDAGFRASAVESVCPHIQMKAAAEREQYEKELGMIDDVCRDSGRPKTIGRMHQIAQATGELKLEMGKTLLTTAKCIACHDSSKTAGPRIRFGNPDGFAEDNERAMTNNGEDLVRSSERLMEKGVHHTKQMPLNGVELDDASRNAIVDYLRSIAYVPRSQATVRLANDPANPPPTTGR